MCAGYLVVEEVAGLPDPLVGAPDDQRPVLYLPVGLPADQRERTFGWARANLEEQVLGWLGALRHLVTLGKVAALATLAGLLMDANRNGRPDALDWLLHLCRHKWGLG